MTRTIAQIRAEIEAAKRQAKVNFEHNAEIDATI